MGSKAIANNVHTFFVNAFHHEKIFSPHYDQYCCQGNNRLLKCHPISWKNLRSHLAAPSNKYWKNNNCITKNIVEGNLLNRGALICICFCWISGIVVWILSLHQRPICINKSPESRNCYARSYYFPAIIIIFIFYYPSAAPLSVGGNYNRGWDHCYLILNLVTLTDEWVTHNKSVLIIFKVMYVE